MKRCICARFADRHIPLSNCVRDIIVYHQDSDMSNVWPMCQINLSVLTVECQERPGDSLQWRHVKWTSWRLKSPTTWLFDQRFGQIKNEENMKALQLWFFAQRIHRWPIDPSQRVSDADVMTSSSDDAASLSDKPSTTLESANLKLTPRRTTLRFQQLEKWTNGYVYPLRDAATFTVNHSGAKYEFFAQRTYRCSLIVP